MKFESASRLSQYCKTTPWASRTSCLGNRDFSSWIKPEAAPVPLHSSAHHHAEMKCKNKRTTLKTKRNEETEAGKGLISTFFVDAGDDLKNLAYSLVAHHTVRSAAHHQQ
jgi:hypothetical protein